MNWSRSRCGGAPNTATPLPSPSPLPLKQMARLAALPELLGAVRSHQSDVASLLRDADVSVRGRKRGVGNERAHARVLL